MTEKDYAKYLKKTFDDCKKFIMDNNGKLEIVISNTPLKKLEFTIPKFKEFEEINIYSISVERSSREDYVHLAGVNILFFLVCLYLRLTNGNKGIFKEWSFNKSYDRFTTLKLDTFIMEETETGFFYYKIKDLKSTGKFKFNLPAVINK